MKSADFWASINTLIDDGFTHDGLQKLDRYAEQFNSSVVNLYINDFHRSNSMAAQREVRRMSLHPYSRQQKMEQIERIKAHSQVSKTNSNAQRNRLNALKPGAEQSDAG